MEKLHTVWLVGVTDITGVGFTVIVKFCDSPLQALADGVTVNTPVIGVVPLLVAVNESGLPEPDAPVPMDVLLLDQE